MRPFVRWDTVVGYGTLLRMLWVSMRVAHGLVWSGKNGEGSTQEKENKAKTRVV